MAVSEGAFGRKNPDKYEIMREAKARDRVKMFVSQGAVRIGGYPLVGSEEEAKQLEYEVWKRSLTFFN